MEFQGYADHPGIRYPRKVRAEDAGTCRAELTLSRPSSRAALCVSLLMSCASPGTAPGTATEDSGATDEVDDTGGDELPETATPLTIEEVVTLAEAALVHGLPDSRDLYAPVVELMAEGDEECPGTSGQIDGPLEGCTASTGYQYIGVLETETKTEEEPEATVHTVAVHNGNFVIVPPEGASFRSACAWQWMKRASNLGSETVLEQYAGTMVYEDADDPFLAEGLSIYAAFNAYRQNDSGDQLTVSASIGWGEHAIRMEDIVLTEQGCRDLPDSGTLHIRHPDGRWAIADFDGSCDCPTWTDPSGVELGEACPELSEPLWGSFERMLEVR